MEAGEKLGALAFKALLVGAGGSLLLSSDGEGGTEIGGVGRAVSFEVGKADCDGIFNEVRGEIDFSLRLEIDAFLLICRFVLEISICDE